MSSQFVPKAVPFVPDLDGSYRQRFYVLVRSWRHGDGQNKHVEALEKEISAIEKDTSVKTDQYVRYRAVLLLLRDLLTTTWDANFEYGQLVLNTFSVSDIAGNKDDEIRHAKEKLQRCMESSRLRIIEDNRDFIQKVESGTWTKQTAPISALLTDGKELASLLHDVINGNRQLRSVIDPEIQLVDDSRDETTGLRLLDIWRYFRYTWSSPAENTPGRSMQYLIRNKALPGRPIMGISSLDNCALALGPRDEYLGWSVDGFVEKLRKKGYKPAEILKLVNAYIDDGIASINCKGLGLLEKLQRIPTDSYIAQLRSGAQLEKDKRRDSLSDKKLKANSDESKDLLFQKKRRDKLASFLDARRQLNEFLERIGGDKNLTYEHFKEVAAALTIAIQAQKEKHIGSSLLELNVCGAIRPYNELLAGKLVALSSMTPYVIDTYRERYKNKASEIASQMLGKDVVRTPDLVYIGTTSLYSVGSSQYNRLTVPGDKIDSTFNLHFNELKERTQGFGTFHISRKTTEALKQVLAKDGSHTVNHQFGEGASPKLRLLGEGVRTLLKSGGMNSVSAFTSHAMPRIIYAVPLIQNLSEYLLGIDKRPKYYGSRAKGDEGTQKILDFWVDRWLRKRLEYAPAIDRVAEFDLSNDKNKFLVGSCTSKENTKAEACMVNDTFDQLISDATTGPAKVQFLRRFYKNGSAFADSTNIDDLRAIHVKTALDDAILKVVKDGKDCVLTGNPGDGKTHVIRILEEKLKEINPKIEPVYDASAMTTEQILDRWGEAKQKHLPFVIAINASVLYELQQINAKSVPGSVREAYRQFESGVVCGEMPDCKGDHVVVFNLGLRSALDESVVDGVIEQMTKKENFNDCKNCPYVSMCGFRLHAKLVQSGRFKDRIKKIFHRVGLVGWHITIRDVQAFFSYLIFGNQSCKNIMQFSDLDEYRIENLIYEKGQGNLFKAVKSTFDPALISLPSFDEELVVGDYCPDDWLEAERESQSAVDPMRVDEFNRRKRAFYFFHKGGSVLLETRSRGAISDFEDFLKKPEKKQLKDCLGWLRAFLGDRKNSEESDSFPIWRGFRFDNSPRRVILSMGSVPRSRFKILRPQLLPTMRTAFSEPKNYVVLQEEGSGKKLKIDFSMYKLLQCSGQKVPVWALEENNEAKKVWRFMEDISPQIHDNDERKIVIRDLKKKEKLSVDVSLDEHRYLDIGRKEVF